MSSGSMEMDALIAVCFTVASMWVLYRVFEEYFL